LLRLAAADSREQFAFELLEEFFTRLGEESQDA
jgi:hypothetical protein